MIISTVDKGNESFNVTLERTPDLHSNITLDPAVGVVEITEDDGKYKYYADWCIDVTN